MYSNTDKGWLKMSLEEVSQSDYVEADATCTQVSIAKKTLTLPSTFGAKT